MKKSVSTHSEQDPQKYFKNVKGKINSVAYS
jgi:hypothetical protein